MLRAAPKRDQLHSRIFGSVTNGASLFTVGKGSHSGDIGFASLLSNSVEIVIVGCNHKTSQEHSTDTL